MTQPVAPVPSLRRGDVDDATDMASTLPAPHSVRALQIGLRRIGILAAGEAMLAGHFDAMTNVAVKRLQWFAANVSGALTPGGVYMVRNPVPLTVDGVVGAATWSFLQAMQRDRLSVTGRLAKVDFPRLMNTYPGIGFTTLVPALGQVGLADVDFAAVVNSMNAKAERLGIYVFVNQLFRVEGSIVSGAVVPPAGFSAHKLGRAIDLQLGHSWRIGFGNPALSEAMATAAIDTPFGAFREHAKTALGCRYGGDFQRIDRPHFDRQILAGGSEEWKHLYFFNQLHFRQIAANQQALAVEGGWRGDAAGGAGSSYA